ncbi:hypothetical protein J6590_044670 [Homalodisca vitripennis]|nr:hypothetical protein J6590_044670 [Homalodisca vitripennis]
MRRNDTKWLLVGKQNLGSGKIQRAKVAKLCTGRDSQHTTRSYKSLVKVARGPVGFLPGFDRFLPLRCFAKSQHPD